MGILKSRARAAVTAFSVRSRHRKAARISQWMDGQGVRTVLMVGALAPQRGALRNAGIVESAVMHGREVKMGINLYEQDSPYPFMVADALDMPFEDNYVDFALANAIIEHVGDEGAQRQFVAEQCRVARSWAITTPNRWFPVESHTAVPFLHWSRKWRGERSEFTRLLSRREFAALLPLGATVIGKPWSATFTALWHEERTNAR